MANAQKTPPAEDFDTVHATLLSDYPELVRSLGGDPRALMSRAGLQCRPDAAKRLEPTYRQLAGLLELSARELACPDFGMRLAQLQHLVEDASPIGRVMRTAATFGDALNFVITHNYAHSLASRIWLHRLAPGTVFVGHDLLMESMASRTQAIEQLLLVGHLNAVALTSGRARVRQVYFRHQPISDPRSYQRYFGCEVRFGQNADGVAYFDTDLAQPITHPDRQAHEALVAKIEQHFTLRRPPIHAEVRGAIMRLLGTGLCDNQRVAEDLHLNLRTLHRRLRAEGTTFQKVKDEVRRDILLYCLEQTSLPFSRISEQLGFSEQAVMTRKCRMWFAASPTQIRQSGQH
ncbi:AraC family transcriptional regulator ligand-binding domain-containing protein [Haliea sp. E17]|uniref:AraC family transcriptional regulator ligand-binding domain-containing protein n=1 Tax=Haliea sp. E17 TaxID=3401576 RepID=UPI003AAC1ADE